MDPEDIQTLEDAKLWIAQHHATCVRDWSDLQEMKLRLTRVETRMIFAAGGASMFGVVAGAFIGHWLGIW